MAQQHGSLLVHVRLADHLYRKYKVAIGAKSDGVDVDSALTGNARSCRSNGSCQSIRGTYATRRYSREQETTFGLPLGVQTLDL